MSGVRLLRRLLGRDGLPPGLTARLDAAERVLAAARLADGGLLVATSYGLWLPADPPAAGDPAGGAPAAAAPAGTAPAASGPAADPPAASVPAADGLRRVGWHLVSKAVWSGGTITLVEARVVAEVAGAVLLADRPPRRLRLSDPRRVPETVQARVTGSIRSRHHRELPGGGAWFVQRTVPGLDGTQLQVRPDPGTDEAAVRQVARDVAAALHRADQPGGSRAG